jgi:hypothetical protein
LGVGVGIGLGKSRPSKAQPLVYCCLNDIISSVELPDVRIYRLCVEEQQQGKKTSSITSSKTGYGTSFPNSY